MILYLCLENGTIGLAIMLTPLQQFWRGPGQGRLVPLLDNFARVPHVALAELGDVPWSLVS